jgi:hypothetical protein
MIYVTTQHEQGVKNRHVDDAAIGHHFLNWLKGPTLAQRYGLRYLYNDIVPHYMGTKWNEFLGLGKIENVSNCDVVNIPQVEWNASWDHPVIAEYVKKYEHSSITEHENTLLRTAPGRGIQIDWQYYLNNDLREKYDFARREYPVGCHKWDTFINIGIHIRRGDINPKDQPERWITNSQYIRLMETITSKFKDDCLFHIYSEGMPASFADILNHFGLAVILHLNDDPIVAFHNLVTCDVLVNAKSAFSVCAAYFHKGPKLCIPFSIYWQQTHPDNDNFKDLIWVNENMDFNINKLEALLG